MARIEMDQIVMIWPASADSHDGEHHFAMVSFKVPDEPRVHWACSCGDTSETTQEMLAMFAKDAAEAKASSNFEYESDQTFLRGME